MHAKSVLMSAFFGFVGFLAIQNDLMAQNAVPFAAYDVGFWYSSTGETAPPDGKIGGRNGSTDTEDVKTLLDFLSGKFASWPHEVGNSYGPYTPVKTLDVSSRLYDLTGGVSGARDNSVSPRDVYFIVTFLQTTKYHQNPISRTDVNADGMTSAKDLLILSTFLSNRPSGSTPPYSNVAYRLSETFVGPLAYPQTDMFILRSPNPALRPAGISAPVYLDVDGDNYITLADHQLVLNALTNR